MVGGVRGRGACAAGACMAGGHVWQGGRAWQILRDTVNERAVRILLECILVDIIITGKTGPSPILFVFHTVTIGTMLNFNDGNNGHG